MLRNKVALALMVFLLVIGGAAGYVAGYSIWKPKAKGYETRISALTLEVSRLNSTISNQQTQISSLRESLGEAKEQLFALEKERSKLRLQLNETKKLVSDYKAQISALQDELNDSKAEIKNLKSQLSDIQAEYESLLERLNQSTLMNPTWEKLKKFLELDDTNTLIYIPDKFDCSGFAITLRDHAWRYGLRCGYVEVSFANRSVGHALNAFRTTDGSLVFVDDTGNENGTGIDTIAYVQVGRPYGVVSLNAVRTYYIDCSGDPTRFWGPLNYTTCENPFTYDYYLSYLERVKFYHETLDAYNKAVHEYNKALDEYNKGIGNYTYEQLESWHEQLESWDNNIEALEKELWPIYEQGDIVETLEIYWD